MHPNQAAPSAVVTQEGSSSELPWALFEFTFRDVAEAVVLADLDRRIVLTNRAATDVFGWSPEELVGKPTRILYASSDTYQQRGRERFNPKAAESREPQVVRYRRRDGQEFDGETIGGPIRAANGRVAGYVGIVRDVSARLSAESVLNRLHRITSNQALSFDARLHEILVLGAEHFALPVGILSRITGDTYTVMDAVTPDDSLAPATTFALGTTYCSHTVQADGPLGFHHVAESDIRLHPCYRTFQLEAYLGAPVRVGHELYGTLNFSSQAPTRPFNGQDLEIIRLMAKWAGYEIARQRDLRALEAAKAELERLATTDPLTGLLNRREGNRLLAEECERAERYGTSLSVLMLDLDHFKRFNDQHGHECGDQALQHFARVARRSLRSSDHLIRWGGEEFLVLLPSTDRTGTLFLAERLLDSLRTASFQHHGTPLTVTASAGVAFWTAGLLPPALLAQADGHLYEAKAAGRDRLHAAD